MRRFFVLALSILAACGNGGFDPPSCGDGEARVRGTLGGMEVAETSVSAEGYAFINAFSDDDGSLDVTSGGAAVLQLQWPELVANGDSVSARGRVDFSSEGGPAAGNCETGAFSGVLTMGEEGSGGTFLLTDLRTSEPYCDAAPVSGELTGCFRSPPIP